MLKSDLIKKIKSGGIAVMPTDTIYGIVACAINKSAVEKVYEIRRRQPDKPFIILISSINDLSLFDIKLSKFQKDFLNNNWPDALSVVLPCYSKNFNYLHRGSKTLAFRYPDKKSILDILKKTGPLIAPSANPEGLVPASDIKDARKYFGDSIIYYGRGKLFGLASTLVSIIDDKINILRQGTVTIK